ncbi:hypothetical protein [Paenibacillus amylolyticus]|uniref:hypothetical protein n=1 Tax=Paenibacillus amylolyticus TaxID=1451 RepID=UPI00201E3EAA|nr:hypothetical protein [Paenibacillus amylolyticus]MCL6663502.1 hypothetical protein [Paenibacillus amylolyticus]
MYDQKASIQQTIEGIEGIEYLTNGLYGEYFEEFLTQRMYHFSDEVVDKTVTLRTEWAIDANSPKSLAMEKQVAELLQIPHRHYDKQIVHIPVLDQTEIESVNAIYEVTQNLLRAKKVDSLVVYRGFGWNERPEWWGDVHAGMLLPINDYRTLSSWSFSKTVAESFVSQRRYGIVVKGIIHANRIFAIINGENLEYESVCINEIEQSGFEITSKHGGE